MKLGVGILLGFVTAQLRPLEPSEGIYLGAWYDRINGDTPSRINQRLGHRPLSFFQVDVNVTQTLQADAIDQFERQVRETGTNAFMMLTVYPYEGFEAVSDAAHRQLVDKIATLAKSGMKLLIRYASEMNGSWFRYGQQPKAFLRNWRKLYDDVKNASGSSKDNAAFLWSPNDGSGYPFTNYGIIEIAAADVPDLDTDRNGRVAFGDDPYSPYFPGDEYVDFVGMSIYHYSNTFPYGSNDIPPPGNFERRLTGRSVVGNFSIYEMFSGPNGVPNVTAGNHPFFVSETGATIFLAVRDPRTDTWSRPPGTDHANRVLIRRSWWRQFLDPAFLDRYPKLKGVSFFEFTKHEDSEFRNFGTFGMATNQTIPVFGGLAQEGDAFTVDALRDDLRGMYGRKIIWGDQSIGTNSTTNSTTTTSAPPAATSTKKGNATTYDFIAFVFTTLFMIF
jgi:hypothetical protein